MTSPSSLPGSLFLRFFPKALRPCDRKRFHAGATGFCITGPLRKDGSFSCVAGTLSLRQKRQHGFGSPSAMLAPEAARASVWQPSLSSIALSPVRPDARTPLPATVFLPKEANLHRVGGHVTASTTTVQRCRFVWPVPFAFGFFH